MAEFCYIVEEIRHLYSISTIKPELFMIIAIEPLYSAIILAALYIAEGMSLLSSNEITHLYNVARLPEG